MKLASQETRGWQIAKAEGRQLALTWRRKTLFSEIEEREGQTGCLGGYMFLCEVDGN